MTTIEVPHTRWIIRPQSKLSQDGKLSEYEFVKTAHQIGASVARIEWEIEQVKEADGVL